MKKRYLILIALIIVVVLVSFVPEFYKINKDLFPFIERYDTYPTARDVLNVFSYAHVIRIEDYIYIRTKDWKLFTPTEPKDYHDEKEIGEIKKPTTNDLWFRSLYAT